MSGTTIREVAKSEGKHGKVCRANGTEERIAERIL
jgi:ribosomal protein L2